MNKRNISEKILDIKREIRDLKSDSIQSAVITIVKESNEDMNLTDTVTQTELRDEEIFVAYGETGGIGRKVIKDDL